MFLRDGMIYATNPTFDQRPEAFNRVRMHVPAHIDFLRMPNAAMCEAVLLKLIVGPILVRIDRGFRQRLFDDMRHDRYRLHILNGNSGNLSFTLNDTQYWDLLRSCTRTTPATLVESSDIGLIDFDRLSISKRPFSLLHQFFANQERHAPSRLVSDAQFPLKLLGRDAAARAGHQIHRIEPQMQRCGRFVKDRARCRMQMMSAPCTGPRLPLLRSLIAFKDALGLALRAYSMFPILREPIAPQPLQAGRIVRKFAHEIHQRVLRVRGFGADGLISIYWRHGVPPLLRGI